MQPEPSVDLRVQLRQLGGGDVDFGLRLVERSLWNVMTPFARLLHRESATARRIHPENDVQQSLRAYARYLRGSDPFFNPNLTRLDRTCRIAPDGDPYNEGTDSCPRRSTTPDSTSRSTWPTSLVAERRPGISSRSRISSHTRSTVRSNPTSTCSRSDVEWAVMPSD